MTFASPPSDNGVLSAQRRSIRGVFAELRAFAAKQVSAALFAILLLALLAATFWLYPAEAALARYDFLTLAAIAIQIALIAARLETLAEARVILVFHLAGTLMEVFKTAAGSWVYPEESLLRIGGVPLFSGFMYAAVGSYLARSIRLYDIAFVRLPPLWAQALLAAGVYVNFFTHHFIWDVRYGLFAASALLYLKTAIILRLDRVRLRLPILLPFLAIAGLIWTAENIATFARAWVYPSQLEVWRPVALAKFGSWYLLMLLSFVLVLLVHRKRLSHGEDRPD